MKCISREVVVVGGFPFLLSLLVLLYSKASKAVNQLRFLPCSDFLQTHFEPLPRLRYHILVTNITYTRPRPLHLKKSLTTYLILNVLSTLFDPLFCSCLV